MNSARTTPEVYRRRLHELEEQFGALEPELAESPSGALLTPLMGPAVPARLRPNAHDARRFMDASHNAPETEADQKR